MSRHSLPVLVVTGESSGEKHAAGLMEQIARQSPDEPWKWFGSGGATMAAQGADLLFDVSELAAIGPWEALAHLGRYCKLYRRILAEARRRQPRLAVLVDFPEFNLRLAPRLKDMGIPVCYFIGPQLWAWRRSRIEQIRRFVDLMLLILPFEEELYRDCGVEAHYVGHPAYGLRNFASGARHGSGGRREDRKVIALLPGSRRREVEQIFPIQLDAARRIAEGFPVYFWVLQAPAIGKAQLLRVYGEWRKRGNPDLPLEIRTEGVARLLPQAYCAIVKSGTSTLEATILQVPFAMVYRLSWLSWYLARPLVGTDTYCLANLIAGRRIVPEFVQSQARGDRIAAYVSDLLQNPDRRERVRLDLERAAEKLGHRDAYREAARYLSEFLQRRSFETIGG